ncbi:5'-3' exoribonuclease [Quillaja saponaria]|uniref:5'-3' exoribonuclease n=1 Tax=Quillaja saponaria TaxID=32244 RepID=A0AAD7KZI2_QUISA|nr:5'-3' exoribonuclease [Quillaja saponaria]
MKIQDPSDNLKIDFERIIDDFIFISFFAGNDFLPHMPSLEILEGAIDLLMTVYKKEFKNLRGYLVDMSKHEKQAKEKRAAYVKLSRVEEILHSCDLYIIMLVLLQILENTKELKENLKDHLRKRSDIFKNGDFRVDKIKFGTKQRYYKEKFSVETPCDTEAKRKEIVQKYTEGLLWVLLYYFSGVPSWTWFYPYHYGPFASDLKGLGQVKVTFQGGVPFKPFDQLLGVLPPRSYLSDF